MRLLTQFNLIAHSLAEIPSSTHEAFASFIPDTSQIALRVILSDHTIQALAPVNTDGATSSFQNNLNLLEEYIDPNAALYVLLRRNNLVYAITFVPYQASEDQRTSYLNQRHRLVQALGEKHFVKSLICKEIGEITDARSWDERDKLQRESEKGEVDDVCDADRSEHPGLKNVGYTKNKCRLCDRRMKNKITPEARQALGSLETEGACVQIVR